MTGTLSVIEGEGAREGFTESALAAIAVEAETNSEPIHLLTLLRFKPKAQYEPGVEPPGGRTLTGYEAYLTFGSILSALMAEAGAVPVMSSSSNRIVEGPTGEKWDMMIIVRYPSRAAFLRLVESPTYQSILHHRTAALADSRTVLTEPRN